MGEAAGGFTVAEDWSTTGGAYQQWWFEEWAAEGPPAMSTIFAEEWSS